MNFSKWQWRNYYWKKNLSEYIVNLLCLKLGRSNCHCALIRGKIIENGSCLFAICIKESRMVWEDLSLNNIKPTRKLSIFLRYFSFVNYSISRNFRFWDNRNLVYNVFFLFHLWPFLKNFAYLKPSSPLWISKTYVYWHIEFDGWKILNLTWFSLEKKLFNVQQYLFQFTNFIARKRFIISNSLPFQWNTQQNPQYRLSETFHAI